jgi:hypothetical protein
MLVERPLVGGRCEDHPRSDAKYASGGGCVKWSRWRAPKLDGVAEEFLLGFNPGAPPAQPRALESCCGGGQPVNAPGATTVDG